MGTTEQPQSFRIGDRQRPPAASSHVVFGTAVERHCANGFASMLTSTFGRNTGSPLQPRIGAAPVADVAKPSPLYIRLIGHSRCHRQLSTAFWTPSASMSSSQALPVPSVSKSNWFVLATKAVVGGSRCVGVGVLAGIPDAVTVTVGLRGIRDQRAIVDAIQAGIAVDVGVRAVRGGVAILVRQHRVERADTAGGASEAGEGAIGRRAVILVRVHDADDFVAARAGDSTRTTSRSPGTVPVDWA